MKNQHNHWFLLYCKGREELRAVHNLENQYVESFFVSVPVEKIIRGKKIIKEEPLFPNYVFVKLDTEKNNFNSIRSTRGVIDFVKCGIEYVKVPISLIDKLKIYHKEESELVFKKNDKLFINSGPFKGLNAIYRCPDGLSRSIVLVNILQGQSRVKIPNENIKVIKHDVL
ncbi:transcription/translation regulatory transformer protein RfaH [Moritella sp. Urea-trap-13]|uniref:transcription/translation regulatory transformer protein RfaH n=1 Tax=Moritella sp. Urea-trap-13 TaxID=2058327 RepID=UPI000C347E6F|nr:transcription/translation regulatory transformer protein RfaH [Moritella sp. Urea-trap-13]PKH05498.1 transcription/translation regulatory transformer protein RfaH [Moritella sp. Urea-trap-13]